MTGRKYIKGCISDTDQVFGFIIIKTPKNPKTTASRRLSPTFSPRSGIDKSVIKIGATKKRAVAVANGNVAIAEKKIMLHKKIVTARKACNLGCVVFKIFNPPSIFTNTSVNKIAIEDLKNIIS
jgi:hypothetical protein